MIINNGNYLLKYILLSRSETKVSKYHFSWVQLTTNTVNKQNHQVLNIAARSLWRIEDQTHVCVTQMEVTQLKADKANVLNHQAAGRNVLLIVNSHTHSCQDAAWYLRLGSLSAQRFKHRCVCLRCLHLPLTSHFLFKTPSSFLIHYDPSMRPVFPFSTPSISKDLTHSYPSSLWENGSCSFHSWGCPDAQIPLPMTTKHNMSTEKVARCTDLFLVLVFPNF